MLRYAKEFFSPGYKLDFTVVKIVISKTSLTETSQK